MGPVGTLIDSAGSNSSGNYAVTLTLNGQQYAVQPANIGVGTYALTLTQALPFLSAGTYMATVYSIEYGPDHSQLVEASIPVTITVADAPITATGVTISAAAAVPWTGIVGSFTDPDLAATAANYVLTIDYADGTAASTTASSPAIVLTTDGAGHWSISDTHTFPNTGSFFPTFNVKDIGGEQADGESTAVVQAQVTVVAAFAEPSEDGARPAYFTFSRTGDRTDALVVYYSLSGTATPDGAGPDAPPADYTGPDPASGGLWQITIPAGSG